MIKIKQEQPHQTGSVSTVYARALLDYLQGIGIDPRLLYSDVLISMLEAKDGRILAADWELMFERAIAHTQDPDLPLKVAGLFQMKYLGMLGFAVMSSRTVAAAISLLLRYQEFITDISTTKMVQRGGLVELHWVPFRSHRSPIFMQLSLGCWAIIARQITAVPENMTADFHFSFPEPQDLSLYHKLFGPGVYFGGTETKVVISQSVLDMPLTLSDPATNSVLVAQVEENVKNRSQPDFLQTVRSYLSRQLVKNRVSIIETAQAFGMSQRTLQYQLTSYGLSYRTLLEQVRQAQAEHYLRTTDLSLSEIAFLLGYSEQSPFQNAFRRWTGQSPGGYRVQSRKKVG